MGMKVNGTSGLTFPDTTTLASAGQASVQAWVNFNGTGTVAIRASFNVASITDNGTGDYTVNFTNALVDANYAINTSARQAAQILLISPVPDLTAPTTTAIRVSSFNSGGAVIDATFIYVAVFR